MYFQPLALPSFDHFEQSLIVLDWSIFNQPFTVLIMGFLCCMPAGVVWPIILLLLKLVYGFLYPKIEDNEDEKVAGKEGGCPVVASCCPIKASKYTCDGDVCVLKEDNCENDEVSTSKKSSCCTMEEKDEAPASIATKKDL